VPNPEFVAGYTADGTVPDLTSLATDPGFNKAIAAAIARVNRSLTPSEQVRRFLIATAPFTIANGLMTPTLKLERHAIRDAYGGALEALYQSGEIAA
jgi:long-chain acyl-CoA synthetase